MGETTEQALERVRRRCWIQLRKPPRHLACCFCAKTFESKEGQKTDADQERERGCAVDWLEHVGRHLVAMASAPVNGSATTSPIKPEDGTEENKAKGHRRKRSGGSGSSKTSIDAAIAEVTGIDEKKPVDPSSFTEPPWAEDELLLKWLIEECLVEESTTKEANGKTKWTLVERGIASEAAMTRRQSNDHEDAERDADGDTEE